MLKKMCGLRASAAALALTAWTGLGTAAAETPGPPPKAPTRTWDLKLGLSYLATAGNTETSSTGFDAATHQEWGLWAFEGSAAAVRATRGEVDTAESYGLQLRSERKVSDRLQLTAGLRGERNRFAGIDLRTITDTSVQWSALDTPTWKLRTLSGLSWTREDPRGERPMGDVLGGLLQVDSVVKLSEGAELRGRMTTYPDLEDGGNFRIDSHLGLQAALNRHLAVRLGYEVKYDHEPVRGFGTTDSSSTASLVVQLGQRGQG